MCQLSVPEKVMYQNLWRFHGWRGSCCYWINPYDQCPHDIIDIIDCVPVVGAKSIKVPFSCYRQFLGDIDDGIQRSSFQFRWDEPKMISDSVTLLLSSAWSIHFPFEWPEKCFCHYLWNVRVSSEGRGLIPNPSLWCKCSIDSISSDVFSCGWCTPKLREQYLSSCSNFNPGEISKLPRSSVQIQHPLRQTPLRQRFHDSLSMVLQVSVNFIAAFRCRISRFYFKFCVVRLSPFV